MGDRKMKNKMLSKLLLVFLMSTFFICNFINYLPGSQNNYYKNINLLSFEELEKNRGGGCGIYRCGTVTLCQIWVGGGQYINCTPLGRDACIFDAEELMYCREGDDWIVCNCPAGYEDIEEPYCSWP
jgi:hypothetical protein